MKIVEKEFSKQLLRLHDQQESLTRIQNKFLILQTS